jgi:16S rRNA (cytidine1402-2'-O)-methyltransferase
MSSYGVLYIVSTPIGNLEDITLRALRVLKDVDIIAAEDTRHTRKLLSHFGISKRLVSYWGAREKVKAEEVIRNLKEGYDVALVSDAGTPGISDPGGILIRRAIMENVDIVPVPGPSAIIAALSVSGISTEEFLYAGFLPSRSAQRIKRLNDLKLEKRTLVFYVSPHRLIETMYDIQEILGDRYCALCHEITKLNEEVLRGKIQELIEIIQGKRIAGEYVLIIEGWQPEIVSTKEALEEVLGLMKCGIGRKEAVKRIARQYGIGQKMLYDESLREGS